MRGSWCAVPSPRGAEFARCAHGPTGAYPFTTDTVLAAIADIPLEGTRVLVQRYGATNSQLIKALEARGATVQEIATYRWALPRDIQPLTALLNALAAGTVHAVVFTSAVQVQHLFAVAAAQQRGAGLPGLLNGLIIASIGPVCSKALAAPWRHALIRGEPAEAGAPGCGPGGGVGGSGARRCGRRGGSGRWCRRRGGARVGIGAAPRGSRRTPPQGRVPSKGRTRLLYRPFFQRSSYW